MQAKNNKKWKIGAEYCAYELYGEKIEGLKFVWIVDITETKIIGKIYEKYHYRTVEFSKKTGKQYRPTAYKWWWLTEREVKRINEKDTNGNRKNRRLDSTNGREAIRNLVNNTWYFDEETTKEIYDLSNAIGIKYDSQQLYNNFMGGKINVKRRKNF